MEFIPIRILTRETQTALSHLRQDGELILTSNGQPTAYMIDLEGQDLVDVVNAFRHSRYIAEKLMEADERINNPEAERFEHDEFWAKVKAL